MEVLFINSCLRSKGISRTYALANHFIKSYEDLNPKQKITYLDLVTERLSPLTYYDIDMQKKGLWSKQHYARQLQRSDKIIIAAPVWNLSFPSALKLYIEYICLPGTTFEHTKDGYNGLCANKKAIYISTMGGTRTPGDTTGAEYIQSVFARLGIIDFEHICIEGMDIEVNDTERLLKDAMARCEKAAARW